MGVSERLYGLSPAPVQSAALSAYGLYLQWLRYGATYRSALKELQRLERSGADAVQAYQTQQLRGILSHALSSVPYYQSRYGHLVKELNNVLPGNLDTYFPLLGKEVVRNDAGAFRSSADMGRCVTINTSGSSGSPLNVLATRKAISVNYAFFERFLRGHGVSYRDRSATFAGRMIIPEGQGKPPFWRYNAAQNTWLLSSYHLSPVNFDAYVAALENIAPVFIDSYPSAIVGLARYINARQIKHGIRPKVIVTSSETLTDQARQEVMQAFGCPVADQYGNAEMAGFIGQCEHGRYHAHSEYGVLEVVDDDGRAVEKGRSGRLVLTGLINPAMPLIRYVIGDSAVLGADGCPCGRPYPVIEEILGRTDDLIITPDGREIGRLDPLFKGLEGVEEAQIVQVDLDYIEVRVVYRQGGVDKPACAAQISAALLRRLDADIRVEVKEVEALEKGKNGKFKAVISRIKRPL